MHPPQYFGSVIKTGSTAGFCENSLACSLLHALDICFASSIEPRIIRGYSAPRLVDAEDTSHLAGNPNCCHRVSIKLRLAHACKSKSKLDGDAVAAIGIAGQMTGVLGIDQAG